MSYSGSAAFIIASVAQSVEQYIIGGIYGDGFALKDTKASRKYMPDSKDVVWENTQKKLLPCTIPEDSEKLCAMVEEMFLEFPERKKSKKK